MKGAGDDIAPLRRPSLAIWIPSGDSLTVSDGGPFGGSILQAIPPSGDESDDEPPIYTPTSSSDGDGYEEYLATQSTSPPAPPLHPLQRGHGRVCVSNAIVGPNSVQIIGSGIGHSQFLVKVFEMTAQDVKLRFDLTTECNRLPPGAASGGLSGMGPSRGPSFSGSNGSLIRMMARTLILPCYVPSSDIRRRWCSRCSNAAPIRMLGAARDPP
jgi:hypothetical protein